MSFFEIEYLEGVARVRLTNGVTNALGPQLIAELREVLEQVRNHPEARSVLLLGNRKFFSIGFDIPALYPLSADEFRAYFEDFNRASLELYTLPKPTVVAIEGHATAGGCILSLGCDYRFISDGHKRMGLNEIKLGVPVPLLADRVLVDLIGVRAARDAVESGDFYGPKTLLELGMVDEVHPLEEVADRAMDKARSLAALPPAAYPAIKRLRVEKIEAQVLDTWDSETQKFTEMWYDKGARARLEVAMKAFQPRSKS